MKVKVIKPFRDKHTKEIHRPGDVLNLKKDRVEEILSKGKYVEPESKNANKAASE